MLLPPSLALPLRMSLADRHATQDYASFRIEDILPISCVSMYDTYIDTPYTLLNIRSEKRPDDVHDFQSLEKSSHLFVTRTKIDVIRAGYPEEILRS